MCRRATEGIDVHLAPDGLARRPEVEWSALSRQCLERRMATKEELASEIHTWQEDRNATGSLAHWRFTANDARVKLAHLHPQH